MAIKLFLSPGIPGNLKVVAAVEFTGVRLDQKQICSNEHVVPYLSQTRHLALQLPTGDFIFSSNAICQYLFTISGKLPSDATNWWLEWEATQLQQMGLNSCVSQLTWEKEN